MDNVQYQKPYDTVSGSGEAALVSSFMRKVYNWMALGLGLTAAAAWMVVSSRDLFGIFINLETGSPTIAYWVVLIGTFGLVMGISAGIQRISVGTATGLFLLYASLMGIFFAPILLMYTSASVFKTFIITAGTFGGTSLWATVTKKDLSGWGSFLFMGIIGIIIASVVNIYLASPMIDWIVSLLGVGLFIGLTAYDTQKLRTMVLEAANETTVKKMAIFGALKLYLDFINLFLFLLRFLGDRR